MSDNNLEKIRIKKAEMLAKAQTMPTELVKIHSEEEFSKLLKDYSDKFIIIDFWAAWCGPCMMFASVFEQLQKENCKEFIFVKVNTDEIQSIPERYRITGIPTILFIKNKKEVHRVVGAAGYDYMKQVLEKLPSFV